MEEAFEGLEEWADCPGSPFVGGGQARRAFGGTGNVQVKAIGDEVPGWQIREDVRKTRQRSVKCTDKEHMRQH